MHASDRRLYAKAAAPRLGLEQRRFFVGFSTLFTRRLGAAALVRLRVLCGSKKGGPFTAVILQRRVVYI